ncbi:DUF6379 domain-containing protein [Alteromonas sp. 1_MG-2023]|uniref:C-glycoside deglycosidase beta subunit domain-containing protein n=1 Tax=Alteromonas sp. 1_MG-2023 TaxID=3062669 RepID=UPI0026E1F431|nr:DUF6379 domain-containing protein [Alteromonas sp. 1_MG-2023]MDO6475277.1 DUF6379 domain-containing protein [Alteromonas sp. 1_MG-2023]
MDKLPVDTILGEQDIVCDGKHCLIEVRLPWYRSLPLSTIEIEKLIVNDNAVESESISLQINDKTLSAETISNLTEEFWFITDSAWLVIPANHCLEGTHNKIELSFVLYPPYIPGFRRVVSQSKLIRLSKEASY